MKYSKEDILAGCAKMCKNSSDCRKMVQRVECSVLLEPVTCLRWQRIAQQNDP